MEWKNEDYRAKFINEICSMHVKLYEYDFYEAAENLEKIYDMAHELIRNIYELTTTQLPLFTLYELIRTDNLDDWCESVLETPKHDIIQEVISDCILFYQ